MTPALRLYPEQAYTTIVEPDILSNDRVLWGAQHPELLGCTAQGDSVDEALRNLADVFRDYVEHSVEQRLDMPAPASKGPRKVIWERAVPLHLVLPPVIVARMYDQEDAASTVIITGAA